MSFLDNIDSIEGLSECINRAIQAHLATLNVSITWPLTDELNRPVLRIEAFLEEVDANNATPKRSKRVASRTLDLAGLITPTPSRSSTVSHQDIDIQPPINGIHSQTTIGSLEDQSENENDDGEIETSRRKGTGGLRITQHHSIREDPSEHQRQMQVDSRGHPKRKKVASDKFVFQPSTLDKLIVGIWEQVHGSIHLDPEAILEQFQISPSVSSSADHQIQPQSSAMEVFGSGATATLDSFSQMNVFCRRVTQASRVCRSIEMLVQARWTELFEDQVQRRSDDTPEFSTTKHRKAVFMEACQDFGWSEKELRNKMAIWRGYKEVKDAAGWAALVFAGMGIYRFCKYRVGFDKEAMRRLKNLRKRLEVAADTLHPHWRQLLAIVGESSTALYPGHPHDWVIFDDGSDPVPLRQTYQGRDPYFAFEHIDESIIDDLVWKGEDPRWTPQSNSVAKTNGAHVCALCHEHQSDDPKLNSCFCFPSLFGCVKRKPPPVQIYRTPDGKNNGLMALVSFDRGNAIGELVGLITKGVRDQDVMDSSTSHASYQIWQGRMGNYTRFINHSCKPNAQSSTFTWLDTQRIVLVSKGVDAGAEITLDYGDKYWAGLNKSCLCGESCCRYRRDGRRCNP
ncbi:hypothetical protein ACN47E_001714 [Coniothyrium glycines]